MSHTPIYHALGLHMHQPPGNMQLLIDNHDWEAQQIIHCYDRATRYAHKYPDTARVHVAVSGILLEQLQDPEVVARYHPHMDIPAMLNSYRLATNIELLDTGYYHPIFTLIPPEDWEDQLLQAQKLMKEIFGRGPKGFYPPAMMFSMEMVPALVKAGYEYVVVDAWQLKTPDGDPLDPYQSYKLRHDKAEIAVVARDTDMSNAQQYGTDAAWFADESRRRAGGGQQARLMCTWSDGENSEWFRNMEENHGYFGSFFAPYMEHVRSGEYPLQPVSISEFLKKHPPVAEAVVTTPDWLASDGQQQALARIRALDTHIRELRKGRPGARLKEALNKARRLTLESETSCFLFWNDTWLGKIYEHLDTAEALIAAAKKPAPKKTAAKSAVATAPAEPAKPVAKAPEAKSAPAKAPEKPAETKPAASKEVPAAKPATRKSTTAPAPKAATADKPAEPPAAPAAEKPAAAAKKTAAKTSTRKTAAAKTDTAKPATKGTKKT